MQRDLLDCHQIEIFPRQDVAFLVLDSQVLVMGAIVLSKKAQGHRFEYGCFVLHLVNTTPLND
jgi:hypothetical protein